MMDENRASVLETPGVTIMHKTGKTGSIRIDLASDFAKVSFKKDEDSKIEADTFCQTIDTVSSKHYTR